jgi:cytidine deaminase
MGRQVGAAISDDEGAIVATGTNEIPRAGGGHYWDGDDPDARDHQRGFDSSDTMIRELLEDALSRLKLAGWRPPEGTEDDSVRAQAQKLISHDGMEGAEFRSLLEYMRPVHAEMSAISDAARRGIPISGASLYCTTFPCHGCARHIVAVGIKRVVYIEPYAKSLVKTLYEDSIAVDERCDGDKRVRFDPYIGIAPRRYLSFFAMGKRKEAGSTIIWKPVDAHPRIGGLEDWLSIEKENRMAGKFSEQLNEARWDTDEGGV